MNPTTVPQDTSYTDADGTTFEVSDRVLTITVPSALTTNSYDYAALVADNYVTNIVKKGDGGLLATATRSSRRFHGGREIVMENVLRAKQQQHLVD